MLRVDVYDLPYYNRHRPIMLQCWFTLEDGETVVKMHFSDMFNDRINEDTRNRINKQGIMGYGRQYTLDEGKDFLEALKHDFHPPYWNAVGPYRILTNEQNTPSQHVWEWNYRKWEPCIDGAGTVPMELWQICRDCNRQRLIYVRTIPRLFKLGTDLEKHELLEEYLSITT